MHLSNLAIPILGLLMLPLLALAMPNLSPLKAGESSASSMAVSSTERNADPSTEPTKCPVYTHLAIPTSVTRSAFVPFVNSEEAITRGLTDRNIAQSLSFPANGPPRVRLRINGNYVGDEGIIIDTGSTAITIGVDTWTADMNQPRPDPVDYPQGWKFLSSSKLLYIGVWVPARIDFLPLGTNPNSPSLASAHVPVLVYDTKYHCPGHMNADGPACTSPGGKKLGGLQQGLYVGVGFGREEDGMIQCTPDKNPLLNIFEIGGQEIDIRSLPLVHQPVQRELMKAINPNFSSPPPPSPELEARAAPSCDPANLAALDNNKYFYTLHPGYIISATGITIGLTPNNTRHAAFQPLSLQTEYSRDPRDWAPPMASIAIDDNKYYPGTLLTDTGIPQSYVSSIDIPTTSEGLAKYDIHIGIPEANGEQLKYTITSLSTGGVNNTGSATAEPWPKMAPLYVGGTNTLNKVTGPGKGTKNRCFVNTGRMWFRRFDEVFDAVGGYWGVIEQGEKEGEEREWQGEVDGEGWANL